MVTWGDESGANNAGSTSPQPKFQNCIKSLALLESAGRLVFGFHGSATEAPGNASVIKDAVPDRSFKTQMLTSKGARPNGSEFTARVVRDWLGRVGLRTLYIEPGSPWGMAITRASIRSFGMNC